MTVTLPDPRRIVLALLLVAAMFGAALAIGRVTRPHAPTVGPTRVQPHSASATLPAGTAPAPPPPLPSLKVSGSTASARLIAGR